MPNVQFEPIRPADGLPWRVENGVPVDPLPDGLSWFAGPVGETVSLAEPAPALRRTGDGREVFVPVRFPVERQLETATFARSSP